MTVLRARALDSHGAPIAGRTAVLEPWTGNRYRNPYDGPAVVRGLTATSGSDGWLSWTLPALQRRPGPRGSLWVITGLEDQPVVLATQPADMTTTGVRVGVIDASGDLVPTPAAPVDTADVTAAVTAAHDTDAERESFIPSRLSDAAIREAIAAESAVSSVNGRTGAVVLGAAEVGSPAVYNIKAYGAVGNGTTDDANAIQAAINAAKAAGGGIIWFPAGTYLIGTTIQVYSASNIVFQGQGILVNNVSGAPMVRFRNCTYCGTAPTLQWIGNWRGSSIALELDGSLYGDFAVRGDQWPTGINVITSASATQNSAFNDLTLDIANGIKGLVFQGDGTHYASNNRINRITWGSAGSGSPIGIDFQRYADTNLCRWAYISLNVAGAIGVLYNSASPSTDQQVYENHFEELILEGYAAGTIGIKGNLTSNYGTRASYVRYRTSGTSLPSISIAGNSEIVCYDSTDGSTGYVGKRLLQAKGTTANRPAPASLGTGGYYFDTTLSRPVFVNTAGTGWVDAAGTAV